MTAPVVTPAEPDRRSRPAWVRVLRGAGWVLAVVLVVVAAFVAVVAYRGNAALTRVDVPGLGDDSPDARGDGGGEGDGDGDGEAAFDPVDEATTVLVVGSDQREDLSAATRRRVPTGERGVVEGVRTDTIILLDVDPVADEVALLSFPRDLFVRLCDGTEGRVNNAVEVGLEAGRSGPGCLVDTLTRYTGIPVDHYVEVDFEGFLDVVDVVGGVRLYLEEPIEDPAAGLDVPAGCVTLDAPEALGFVRTRNVDNDFGRIARQQRFLAELLDEVTAVGTAANPVRLLSLVETGAEAVTVDSGLSFTTMRDLAFTLRDLSSDQLATYTVPTEVRSTNPYYLDATDEARQLFRDFRAGRLTSRSEAGPTSSASAAPPPTPAPETTPAETQDVGDVVVLNGLGERGVAGAAADVLTGRGFTVSRTGDLPSFDSTTPSQVLHPLDQEAEAQTVSLALGGLPVVADDDVEELTVVVGRGLLDGDPPDLRGTGATPPSASPSPTFVGVPEREVPDC